MPGTGRLFSESSLPSALFFPLRRCFVESTDYRLRDVPESVRLCEDSELVRGELSSIFCDNFVWKTPVSKQVLNFADCTFGHLSC